ncbi:type I-B CRISPR-associated protein Cas5b [Methanosphaera sp. Vir-13MRS]|uniref:type I-B CRISPR-associated protein Cas5b n=1 Tax=Candidatus Methanosphaera massiliense TaxID=3017187 RepID=UPI00237FE72C|nr:type I-B CRISPR-associated protein Cas5b [Candidatus Methanosphaera massiliense]MDE4078677.1 type I-B CRISPR-associated protein Cas5b [Candidatus Methanosphaera massiliense]
MDNEKVIVFDIWSDLACFRRGYTTTSILSYPFPSRTTISGIIAGILGLERNSYQKLFQKNNSKIGLKILNPIKRTRLNLNYIETRNDPRSSRTQIPIEYIKNAKYRIYVHLDNTNQMNELFYLIKNHKTKYSVYMGVTECLANYSIVGNGLHDLKKMKGKNINIDSVVLKNKSQLIIEKNKKYGIIKSPGFFNNNREVTEFIEYYYEELANSIKLKECEYYRIGEDNVMLY